MKKDRMGDGGAMEGDAPATTTVGVNGELIAEKDAVRGASYGLNILVYFLLVFRWMVGVYAVIKNFTCVPPGCLSSLVRYRQSTGALDTKKPRITAHRVLSLYKA